MNPLFSIGKIVTAACQKEAIELFQNRKELGIGGVIFHPEMSIPQWTEEEKTALARTKIRMNPHAMKPDDETLLRDVWKARAGDITYNLIQLSKQFNSTNRTRGVWFIENDEIKFTAHRDEIAREGYIHLHCEGAGMICLTPTGDEPVYMKTVNPAGTYFDQEEIRSHFNEGRLEPIALEPKQAIAFDHTMVHFSQPGKRFRILTFDQP